MRKKPADWTFAENEINQDLVTKTIPLLQQEYPGLTFTMGGEQEEQQESLKSLRCNFIIALFAIFATAITLLLVPSLYMILEDIKIFFY